MFALINQNNIIIQKYLNPISGKARRKIDEGVWQEVTIPQPLFGKEIKYDPIENEIVEDTTAKDAKDAAALKAKDATTLLKALPANANINELRDAVEALIDLVVTP